MQFFLVVLLLAATAHVTLAGYGVDVGDYRTVPVSEDRWKCIKNRGYDFAVVQIHTPDGVPISAAPSTIKNARAEKEGKPGIKRVDGYISPATLVRTKDQVKNALEHIRKNGADIDQLWLEVGILPNAWGGSYRRGGYYSRTDNVKFIQGLVDEAKSQNITVGIYTKRSQWKRITDNTDQFKSLPLWYVHHDDKANFSDFKNFGGWTQPTMKQYKGLGHTNVCEVTVNKDWFP